MFGPMPGQNRYAAQSGQRLHYSLMNRGHPRFHIADIIYRRRNPNWMNDIALAPEEAAKQAPKLTVKLYGPDLRKKFEKEKDIANSLEGSDFGPLPCEVRQKIVDYCTYRVQNNLRLTCRLFHLHVFFQRKVFQGRVEVNQNTIQEAANPFEEDEEEDVKPFTGNGELLNLRFKNTDIDTLYLKHNFSMNFLVKIAMANITVNHLRLTGTTMVAPTQDLITFDHIERLPGPKVTPNLYRVSQHNLQHEERVLQQYCELYLRQRNLEMNWEDFNVVLPFDRDANNRETARHIVYRFFFELERNCQRNGIRLGNLLIRAKKEMQLTDNEQTVMNYLSSPLAMEHLNVDINYYFRHRLDFRKVPRSRQPVKYYRLQPALQDEDTKYNKFEELLNSWQLETIEIDDKVDQRTVDIILKNFPTKIRKLDCVDFNADPNILKKMPFPSDISIKNLKCVAPEKIFHRIIEEWTYCIRETVGHWRIGYEGMIATCKLFDGIHKVQSDGEGGFILRRDFAILNVRLQGNVFEMYDQITRESQDGRLYDENQETEIPDIESDYEDNSYERDNTSEEVTEDEQEK